MDNTENNGLTDINNNFSSDSAEAVDIASQPADSPALTVGGETAPAEVAEVMPLPENEAMMALNAVSSDMPSISAVTSAQPVAPAVSEPAQMASVSAENTAADSPINAVGASAPALNDPVGDLMPGISADNTAQQKFAPYNNGAELSGDNGSTASKDGLQQSAKAGVFSAAKKSAKNKNAPTVADAYSLYPDAPTVQKSTGRPLTAEEARKYYATHKPEEKKEEEQPVEEEPDDTSKDTPKLIIYFAILAICVIALAGCIIGLITSKPEENDNGGAKNPSSSVSDNENTSSDGAPAGETLTLTESNKPGAPESSSDSGAQSVSEKPSQSGQSSSSASSHSTTKVNQGQTSQTTRRDNVTLPSSVTTKTPSPAPATSSQANSPVPSSSASQASSPAVQTTVKPQSSTSHTSYTPQTTTTTKQTTTATTKQTTTTTTKKPQTTTTVQTSAPTPVKKLYALSCTFGQGWDDGSNKVQEVTFIISNNSGTDIGDWSLVLQIDGVVSGVCYQGETVYQENKVIISNKSWSSGILNGGTRKIVCQITTKNGVKIKSATLNGSAVEIS